MKNLSDTALGYRPQTTLINGWLPQASGIDILYTASPIAVRSEIARMWRLVDDTQYQDENQTYHGDGLSVSLPDISHNPEPQSYAQ